MIIALTTFPEGPEATVFAEALIRERLAACVQVLPQMTSVYEWEGKIEKSTEHLLLIKTEQSQISQLQKRLYEVHPYSVPEFLVLSSEQAGSKYLAWVNETLAKPTLPPIAHRQDGYPQ